MTQLPVDEKLKMCHESCLREKNSKLPCIEMAEPRMERHLQHLRKRTRISVFL